MASVFSTTTSAQTDGESHQQIQPATLRLIADYDIHHSPEKDEDRDGDSVEVMNGVRREAQPAAFDPTLAPHPTVPYPVTNPEWWQRTYRRVPDYRPINRELDLEERRQGLLFTIIGGIMIRGCAMITVRS